MLVLKRKDGQELEITHAETGDVLVIRVYDIQAGYPGRATLAFDEHKADGSKVSKENQGGWLFNIHRPERDVQSTREHALV